MTRALLALALAAAAGCGGAPAGISGKAAPAVRRSVVWLGPQGLDDATAVRLAAAGVDEVVEPLGAVSISSGVPVMRLATAPPVSGGVPVGVELRLDVSGAGLSADVAEPLWNALQRELGSIAPAELLLDLPRLVEGTDALIRRLAELSGLAVRPVLTVDQLPEPMAVEVVRAAGGCVVLCFGRIELVRPGAKTSELPLDEQLAPLAGLAVRPRIGIVVRPAAEPQLPSWGGSLDPLTEGHTADISTTSTLDRTFRFRRAVVWSGRTWQPGDTIALAWSDAARLDWALARVGRLLLPSAGGWDIIGLPAPDTALGLTRDGLLAYLEGDGPAPALDLDVTGTRSQMLVGARNAGPFASAVSAFGNWVEVAVPGGTVKVIDPGGFDAVELGSGSGGAFRPVDGGPASVARLLETYVAPGEEIAAATLRVSGRPGAPVVSWHVTLSSGEFAEGRSAN